MSYSILLYSPSENVKIGKKIQSRIKNMDVIFTDCNSVTNVTNNFIGNNGDVINGKAESKTN